MLWLLLKTEGQPQHSRHPVQQEEEADSKTLIRIQVLWVLPYFSSFLISPSSLPPQPREGGTADANGLHPKCEKKNGIGFSGSTVNINLLDLLANIAARVADFSKCMIVL